MYDSESLKSKIVEKLNDAKVKLVNPRGDSEHFIAEVVWDGFEGLSLVERHKVIYKILDDDFKAGMHSLSLKTKTNSEIKNE